jgi:hypothetical protein
MKLRIQENTLRFRLTQTEVALLRDAGHVESCITFAPGRALAYRLERSVQELCIRVDFDDSVIRVTVPAGIVTGWADSDQVGIEASSEAGAQILIEKDFQCLHKPADRDPDGYPNPLAAVKT